MGMFLGFKLKVILNNFSKQIGLVFFALGVIEADKGVGKVP